MGKGVWGANLVSETDSEASGWVEREAGNKQRHTKTRQPLTFVWGEVRHVQSHQNTWPGCMPTWGKHKQGSSRRAVTGSFDGNLRSKLYRISHFDSAWYFVRHLEVIFTLCSPPPTLHVTWIDAHLRKSKVYSGEAGYCDVKIVQN